MFCGIQILGLGALPVLMQVDHKSSSSDDVAALQQMEKREKIYRKCVCKFCTGLYFVMQLNGCVTGVMLILLFQRVYSYSIP